MKQRVSLACAIVHQPALIFLDEPTVGLDPELRVHFWNYFTELTKAGHTLVISSHTFDDAAHCQQLAFLRLGKVVAQGAPAELRAATGNKNATLEDAFLYFIKHIRRTKMSGNIFTVARRGDAANCADRRTIALLVIAPLVIATYRRV